MLQELGPEAASAQVARTPTDLERLRPFWQQWESHPTAEWRACEQLVAQNGGATKTVALIHGSLDAPRAALVAMDGWTHASVSLGYWRLAKPRVRVLSVKHGGAWLGPATDDSARAILGALRREMKECGATIVHLEHFPVDHPLVAAAETAGATRMRPEPDVNWRVAIPGSWAEFTAACSKNTRRNLKRYPERFLEEFGTRATVHCLKDPSDLPRITAEMEAVAAHSYHRGLGAGFMNAPEQRALIEAALANGTYRCWVLAIDGAPAAFWDGRRCASTFFTDFTAYLPQYRDARPGWYLLSRVIADLCGDEAVETIDFGQGDAQYKQMLGTVSTLETSLAMYAPTLRGQSLRALVRTSASSTRMARRLLDRFGLLGRVKRLWRGRLADAPKQAGNGEKPDDAAGA